MSEEFIEEQLVEQVDEIEKTGKKIIGNVYFFTFVQCGVCGNFNGEHLG